MTVVVGQGTAGIGKDTYPTNYRYWIANTTTSGTPAGESVTITTASASNPRIDTIVAYVNEGASFNTSPVNFPGGFTLAAVAGTPNASPTAPSAGTIQSAIGGSNPYIVLADVLVGTSVTQINSGNITDRRSRVVVSSNPYKFSAYRNSAWTDGNGTFSTVVFDTEDFDSGNNYDTSNGRFTAPINGFYQFNASANKSVSGNSASQLAIYKNGTSYAVLCIQVPAATTGHSDVGSILLSLSAGDYVQIASYGSGGAGNVSRSTHFSGFLVSPT